MRLKARAGAHDVDMDLLVVLPGDLVGYYMALCRPSSFMARRLSCKLDKVKKGIHISLQLHALS